MADDTEKLSTCTTFVVLYLTAVIDNMCGGVIYPLIPYVALSFHANGFWIGVVSSSFAVGRFIGTSLWASLSDRYGRRIILLFTLFATTLVLASTGFAASLWVLIILRLLSGFFSATFPLCLLCVTDVTEDVERPKYMSRLSAATSTGFIFGPTLGGAASSLGFTAACGIAGATGLANTLLACLFLAETLPPERRRGGGSSDTTAAPSPPHPPPTARPCSQLLRLLRLRPLLVLALARLCFTSAFLCMESMLGLYLSAVFRAPPATFGLLMGGIGVTLVLSNVFAVPALLRRVSERTAAAAACVGCALSLAAAPVAATVSLPCFFVACFAQALFISIHSASNNTMLSLLGSGSEKGAIVGLGRSVSQLCWFGGPMLAGLLFEMEIPVEPFSSLPHPAAYFAGAVLAFFSGCMYLCSDLPSSSGGRTAEQRPSGHTVLPTEDPAVVDGGGGGSDQGEAILAGDESGGAGFVGHHTAASADEEATEGEPRGGDKLPLLLADSEAIAAL